MLLIESRLKIYAAFFAVTVESATFLLYLVQVYMPLNVYLYLDAMIYVKGCED